MSSAVLQAAALLEMLSNMSGHFKGQLFLIDKPFLAFTCNVRTFCYSFSVRWDRDEWLPQRDINGVLWPPRQKIGL